MRGGDEVAAAARVEIGREEADVIILAALVAILVVLEPELRAGVVVGRVRDNVMVVAGAVGRRRGQAEEAVVAADRPVAAAAEADGVIRPLEGTALDFRLVVPAVERDGDGARRGDARLKLAVGDVPAVAVGREAADRAFGEVDELAKLNNLARGRRG